MWPCSNKSSWNIIEGSENISQWLYNDVATEHGHFHLCRPPTIQSSFIFAAMHFALPLFRIRSSSLWALYSWKHLSFLKLYSNFLTVFLPQVLNLFLMFTLSYKTHHEYYTLLTNLINVSFFMFSKNMVECSKLAVIWLHVPWPWHAA